MVTAKMFSKAIQQLKTNNRISPVTLAEVTGIGYDRLNNMKRGRQTIPDEVIATIVDNYPQFAIYIKEGEDERPGEASNLESKSVDRNFSLLIAEISDLRIQMERALKETAERELKFTKELLEMYKDRLTAD